MRVVVIGAGIVGVSSALWLRRMGAEVTGIDLVEAQFRIAGGATLADLGLADQAAVPEPRGFAVQARVVATGPGTLSAYREPSGPGVRVDGSGYLGYSPSPR